jgi:hypothetical protein
MLFCALVPSLLNFEFPLKDLFLEFCNGYLLILVLFFELYKFIFTAAFFLPEFLNICLDFWWNTCFLLALLVIIVIILSFFTSYTVYLTIFFFLLGWNILNELRFIFFFWKLFFEDLIFYLYLGSFLMILTIFGIFTFSMSLLFFDLIFFQSCFKFALNFFHFCRLLIVQVNNLPIFGLWVFLLNFIDSQFLQTC